MVSHPAKAALRRTLLKQRQHLSPQIWREKSDRLCTLLQASPWLQDAQTILAYFSIRQEPDLSLLFAGEWGRSRRWGFPRCVEQQLLWHGWSPDDDRPLQSGAFGILEPHPDAPTLMPEEVDLLLVPAVGCNRRGYRLGYGGGFYDRLFSLPEWRSKPAIGVVFDFALVDELAIDAWDQPLFAVATESGVWPIDP